MKEKELTENIIDLSVNMRDELSDKMRLLNINLFMKLSINGVADPAFTNLTRIVWNVFQ